MLRKLFVVLLVVTMGFIGLIALQPSTFEVSRMVLVPAPPSDVFAMVNDLHRWDGWSPWLKLDPNARMTYEGPDAGPGAAVRWAGNEEVGEGRMEILENRPDERVRLRLEFIKPFPGKSEMEFDFEPAEGGTQVTWSMTGHNNLVGKVMCLFIDMDKKIGGDFERGLANLRGAVPAAAPSGT
jgi:uncharacterized protein YndB with AHSA1/START domain